MMNNWELSALFEKVEELRKEDLELYQTNYIKDILTVYKNELENIIIKSEL